MVLGSKDLMLGSSPCELMCVWMCRRRCVDQAVVVLDAGGERKEGEGWLSRESSLSSWPRTSFHASTNAASTTPC